jgi:hypothetical protein
MFLRSVFRSWFSAKPGMFGADGKPVFDDERDIVQPKWSNIENAGCSAQ